MRMAYFLQNMAEKKKKIGQILKGMKLQIVVEEVVNDVLVVVLEYNNKIYRGVLLDTKKRNLPSGICSAFNGNGNSTIKPENFNGLDEPSNGSTQDGNVDISASTFRHTYYQNHSDFGAAVQSLPNFSFPRLSSNKTRNIRLRPRQTLCSKCKSTCLDSSKGPLPINSPVKSNNKITDLNTKKDYTKKDSTLTRASVRKRLNDFQNDHIPKPTKLIKVNPSMPKLTKSSPFIKISIGDNNVMSIPPRLHQSDKEDVSSSEERVTDLEDNIANIESHIHETRAITKDSNDTARRSLRTLREKKGHLKDEKRKENISLHKHRKKTRLRNTSYDENDGDTGGFIITENIDSEDNDEKCENGASNQIELVKRRPRLIYTWHQNKGLSPRTDSLIGNNVDQKSIIPNGNSSSQSDEDSRHFQYEPNDGENMDGTLREKRKVYRLRKRSRSVDSNPGYEITEDSAYVSYEDPKCVSDRSEECSTEMDSSSDTDSSDYGDGPPCDENLDAFRPLMMKIQTKSVLKCVTQDGHNIQSGDIMWGKIKGFPWWPGRVMSISICQTDNGVAIRQTAHLAWFGCNTTSHIQCSELHPFLKDFKNRYKRKKKGPYKLAIKQATIAARACENHSDVESDTVV